MSPRLHDFQVRATAAVRGLFADGNRAVLLVAPTGAGKTRMGAELAEETLARGRRVLWLAHRQELVSQASERLRAQGILSGAVVVASTQKLLARDERPSADLVVFDEAHHYLADEWRRLEEHYTGARLLGLTATPERGDGRPLGDIFEAIVVAAQPRELIAGGYLVPCKVYAPDKHQGRAIAQSPVDMWKRFGGKSRRTVIFAPDRDAAKRCAEDIAALGGRVAYVDGQTQRAARAESLVAFEAGRLDTLVNVHVLTEGWDCPPADVCILARPCRTPGQYIQIVGRILRAAKGKRVARLIDLAGAVHKHGSPTKDREYSLVGKRAIVLKAVEEEEWADDDERERKPRGPMPITGDEVGEYISLYTDWGKKYCVDGLVGTIQWHAIRIGVSPNTIRRRVKENGMSVDAAVRVGKRTSSDANIERANVYEHGGFVGTIYDHAARSGIKHPTLHNRINNMGLSMHEAIMMGNRSSAQCCRHNAEMHELLGIVDTIGGHARRHGINPRTLRYRVKTLGMSMSDAISHAVRRYKGAAE